MSSPGSPPGGSPPPPAPYAPPVAPVPAGAPAPVPGRVPPNTIYILLGVGGGLTLLAFLLGVAQANGTAAPAEIVATLFFLGLVTLVVGLILGAAAGDFPQETRIVMGVLAGLLLILALAGFWWLTAVPVYTCGAALAAPAIFALRLFAGVRDGVLGRPAGDA